MHSLQLTFLKLPIGGSPCSTASPDLIYDVTGLQVCVSTLKWILSQIKRRSLDFENMSEFSCNVQSLNKRNKLTWNYLLRNTSESITWKQGGTSAREWIQDQAGVSLCRCNRNPERGKTNISNQTKAKRCINTCSGFLRAVTVLAPNLHKWKDAVNHPEH